MTGSPYSIVASNAVGSGLGNYTICYVNGSLTVNPAPLTITADSIIKTYGQTVTLSGTDFTTSGLVNSDSVASVSLSSTGAAATATVTGSPYAIVASNAVGSGLSNYTITYVNGSLTVNPAPLTITAGSITKTYGQTVTLSDTDFNASGLVNSDSVASVTLSSTGAAATAAVTGSPYAIVASGAVGSGLGNYTISYLSGSLTVNPAPLVITADNMTKTYGQTLTFGSGSTQFTSSGLQNSNTIGSVTLAVSGNGGAATAAVGSYTITPSAATAGTFAASNYTIAYDTGTLTVVKASPTITTTPSTTTGMCGTSETLKDTATLSGGYDPTGTITFTLYSPSDTLLDTETVTVNGDGTYSTPKGYTLPSNAAAGTYQWDASYSGDNYNNAATDDGATNEQVVVGLASPTITTRPSTTSATCGTSVTLMDTATLSGGDNPTGTITFTLYSPSDTLLDTETVTVNGDGTYSTPKGYTLASNAAAGTYQWDAGYSGDKNNNAVADDNDKAEQVGVSAGVCNGQTAPLSFWCGSQGQSLINCFNGGSSSTNLGNWLASACPNLFGSLSHCTNSQIASYCNTLNNGNANQQACGQVLATAISCYTTNSNLAGNAGQSCGFTVTSNGTGACNYNVGSNGSGLGVANNSSCSVSGLLHQIDSQSCNGAINSSAVNAASSICGAINQAGGRQNATLSATGLAYTPAQIRAAYGINNLSLDGTGQTIAIVDAYDDPDIFQAVDDFDTQFGLTASGPSLYDQYGPASSFLTVINENGQSSPLPATDPSGPGTDNWEVEESLDVEWAHAIAPGAQIILVEANSQSLSDLMASVSTAASQPGVSVVSMSWGFAEGQTISAAQEATYDSVFNVPGVTFVASTGDYGAADPEYPAYSPNVVAVGGTSLNLNANGSYNSETGWGYQSASAGAFIGSGGGISLYEPEPAYQEGVQSTGSRTTPDVSLVADPATGAWIADPYNLDPSNPFEVVGGTSLSAPAWAGLLALVNQGSAAQGGQSLNSSSPTETQQALYSLPQNDYNVISSGYNGYNAGAGYNLVTGLGTPVANLLVSDLVAYQSGTVVASGPTVAPVQNANLVNTGATAGETINVFSVFDSLIDTSTGLGSSHAPGAASTISTQTSGTPAPDLVASQRAVTPVTTFATSLELAPGASWQSESVQAIGASTNASPLGQALASPATVTIMPASTTLGVRRAEWSTPEATVTSQVDHAYPGGSPASHRAVSDRFIPSGSRTGLVFDAVLDELAGDSVVWPGQPGNGTITISVLGTNGGTLAPVIGDPLPQRDRRLPRADYAAGLAVLGLAGGLWVRGTGIIDARKRPFGRAYSRKKSI